MDRKDMYATGCFFIRKRHIAPRCRLYSIAPEWAIYISREFGKWRLVNKFDTEAECDYEIQCFADLYYNCIIE